jgi:hypothetical protein
MNIDSFPGISRSFTFNAPAFPIVGKAGAQVVENSVKASVTPFFDKPLSE